MYLAPVYPVSVVTNLVVGNIYRKVLVMLEGLCSLFSLRRWKSHGAKQQNGLWNVQVRRVHTMFRMIP